ncbi:hypothetical protein [Cupriavidus sp. TMH.W2]|uniref:hypothetical protein n=1 Tax=Cupriavidus sp. TMH.W2 TaxID=3434465 RepID=UPI003D77C0C8
MPNQSRSERAAADLAKSAAPEAVANAVTIHTNSGTPHQVLLSRFPALEGYDLSRGYRDYVTSKDPTFRRAFVLKVLGYCSIEGERLDTPETVNRRLENWRNVDTVFLAALTSNDIDPELEVTRNGYWLAAGESLAASFIAGSARLILPLMASMQDAQAEEAEEAAAPPDSAPPQAGAAE